MRDKKREISWKTPPKKKCEKEASPTQAMVRMSFKRMIWSGTQGRGKASRQS
jgi:hypothetical protein